MRSYRTNITAPARLHFGLFGLQQKGKDDRAFGGIGAMIRELRLRLPSIALRTSAWQEFTLIVLPNSPGVGSTIIKKEAEFSACQHAHPKQYR